MKILGRPFGLPREAWMLPSFQDGVLGFSDPTAVWDGAAVSWLKSRVQSAPTSPAEFRLQNDSLYLRDGEDAELFDKQSYIVFSVTSPESGIDLQVLRDATKAKDVVADLGVRTGNMGPEDMKASLDAVSNALQGFAIERQVRDKYANLLAKAKTPGEVEALKGDFDKEIVELRDKFKTETATSAIDSVDREYAQKIRQKQARLSTYSFDGKSQFFQAAAVGLVIAHPPDLKLEAYMRLKGENAFQRVYPDPTGAVAVQPLHNRTTIAIPGAQGLDGEYELLVVAVGSPDKQQTLRFWVVAPPVFKALDPAVADPAKTEWKEGQEVRVAGEHLAYVRAVRGTLDGGKERVFKVRQERDATGQLVALVFKNDLSHPVKLIHARFVMMPAELDGPPLW